jgi:AbrB family looped-hinge helix DNA binding protein
MRESDPRYDDRGSKDRRFLGRRGRASMIGEVIHTIARVSERGQIVIPAEIRRAVGMHANQRVDVTVDDGTVRIRPLPPMPLVAAQGKFRGQPLVDVLLEERRRDG